MYFRRVLHAVTLLYGCESWTLKTQDVCSIQLVDTMRLRTLLDYAMLEMKTSGKN